ncbi:hypothetical protein MUP79_08675 [Candidatus Bathyarchaeota archaeon]|nr:hypothetical protein [Candidatus Bathyarchaeota archaeon]
MPVEPIKELEELKIQWYFNTAVKFEIVKTIKYRESIFLSTAKKLTHRCLKINALKFLEMNMERFNFFEPNLCFNLYCSLATYPEMPMFSYNMQKKAEEMQQWNLNALGHIKSYDLAFDIDNVQFEKAYATSSRLKAMLDEFQVPYHCKFSGTKGMHFVIPYENLPAQLKSLPMPELCAIIKQLAYELKIYWGLKDLDMKIYDLRRIWKTPFSVVYPFYYVALPLTDEQFDHFKLEDVWLPNLIAKADTMRDRGLLMRERPADNLMKFIRHVAEKQQHKTNLYAIFKKTKPYLLQQRGKLW